MSFTSTRTARRRWISSKGLACVFLHLLVDGPEVLGTAGDLEALEPGAAQLLLERNPQPLDGLLALALSRLDLACQRAIVLRLEELAGEICELGLHASHT